MSSAAVSKMTHRATVHRDGAVGTDDWNNPNIPDFAAHIASQRCFAWSKTKTDVTDEGKTAFIQDTRMIMPLGTDVTEGDRITAIKNRLGATLFSGNFRVAAVERTETHLELALERIHGTS